MITIENKEEFLGQIIDNFEDWLEKKGIATEDEAIICGSDYDELKDELECTMNAWHVLEREY